MNVTVFGDSILKGVLLLDGKYVVNHEWEERVEQQLGVPIRNRSRFGCTIRKALPFIRKDCEAGGTADEYVVLEFGGNDCDYQWAEISAEPDGSFDCKTPPALFTQLYREAIRQVRESGRTPVAMTLPPIHSERYLHFICRHGLSENNILHWLGDVEAISRWQERYSAMVRELAGEEHVKLIDLREAFPRDQKQLGNYLCEDGIHPSRAGQELILQTLCAAMG